MNEEQYMAEYNKLIDLKKDELVEIYMNLAYTKKALNTTSEYGKFLLSKEREGLLELKKSTLAMMIIQKKEEAFK